MEFQKVPPVRVRRVNLLQRDNDDEFDEVLSRRQSLNKYTEWQRVPEDSCQIEGSIRNLAQSS